MIAMLGTLGNIVPQLSLPALAPLATLPGEALVPLLWSAMLMLALRSALKARARDASGDGRGIDALEARADRSSRERDDRVAGAPAGTDMRPAA